jgi:hypothetical protein
MSAVISNLYHLVIQLPGSVWRAMKNFVGNSLPKWWDSHY